MIDEKSKLVFSTDKAIPRKEQSAGKSFQANVSPAQQRVIIRFERKGRGGKVVTVIEGLQMPEKERGALLKQLKMKLGTGGTIKDSSFEIQGDRCIETMAELEKMGYRPKRSG
jgi:translation initiation factor 1